MDLSFTEEENMIREAIANLLKKESSFAHVKEIEESAEGYCPKLWAQMAELDLLGTLFDEDHGGSELPFIYTAIIMEELGKAAMPSPYLSTIIESGLLIHQSGSEAQKSALLPKIASGELLMSVATLEAEGSYREDGIQLEAKAVDGAYLLSGTKYFVADANIAHKLIVSARTGEGASLFLVDVGDGVAVEKLETVSMANNCLVKLDNARGELLGELGAGWSTLEAMNHKACVAQAAEMVGGCQAALQITVGYSREREQYGRPIGGYQVLQHYMSNMLMATDTSFNYLYKVVWQIDEELDFAREAHALKAYVNEQYKFVTERSIQIHGGIGTTRECHIGLFFRRAKTAEYAQGDTAAHYDALAGALGL